jgi:acyl-coenzyme A thioesterase PaaI-like protein
MSEPLNPAFAEEVRNSFAQQKIMSLFGARLRKVAPGQIEIELPYRDDLTQQHGTYTPESLQRLPIPPVVMLLIH